MNTLPLLPRAASSVAGLPDPGWPVIAAYSLAVLFSILASRRCHRIPGTTKGSPVMWLLTAALMGFLLSGHLDPQHRHLLPQATPALHPDLFPHLRPWILGTLAASAAGTLVFLVWFLRDFWKHHAILILGLSLLLSLVALRHSPEFAHALAIHKIGSRSLGSTLELTATAIVTLASFLEYQNPRKTPPKPWRPAT